MKKARHSPTKWEKYLNGSKISLKTLDTLSKYVKSCKKMVPHKSGLKSCLKDRAVDKGQMRIMWRMDD